MSLNTKQFSILEATQSNSLDTQGLPFLQLQQAEAVSPTALHNITKQQTKAIQLADNNQQLSHAVLVQDYKCRHKVCHKTIITQTPKKLLLPQKLSC
jgi:hypothetical protein